MKSEKLFEPYSFLLLAHYATFAYQDLLFEYLTKRKGKLVTKMNFPLPELPVLKHIEMTNVREGKFDKTKSLRSLSTPPFLAYIFQSFQLLYLVLKHNQRYSVAIAEDSLLAFLCVLLKKIGKIQTVIFYSHGLDKKRFNNSLMNFLYQKLEHFSSTNSDYNWFLNRSFTEFRKKQGIKENTLFWIPSSVEVKTVKRKTDVFNHKLVFLGVVNKKNGAHIIPKIMQKIKKEISDVKLDVIGNGDLFDWLKKEIKRLNLQSNIRLLGMLEFKDFAPLLTDYSVGIAPYEDVFDTLTATSDSLKMRIYLAAGLPVVITKGFIFSNEIEENDLGFAVDFKADAFADAIVKLLREKDFSLTVRKRALNYSKEFDIINIYNRTFQKILENQ